MKSFSKMTAAIATLSIATMLSSAAHAQARPSAADVIAKYVAAIGGTAEIMKLTSIKQVGTMEIPAAGITGQMETMTAAPNKSASKMSFPGIGEQQMGYDGKVAWDVNPMAGPRLLADKELAAAADNADFYGNLLYSASRFSSMETVGDTTVGTEKAYVLKLVNKATGAENRAYFSATSGLLLGGVSSQESQMGKVEFKQMVSDYKKFGGILIPTKIDIEVGPQKMSMTIKEVVVNGVPTTAFEIPAQVKPLIKP